jgi:replicative DNA helicase
LKFGVSFLDDCFLGIRKTDLIAIGAESGTGKTQLGTMIASNVAAKGKRVHYFALEAYKREIELRIVYQIAAEKYFSDPERIHFPVAFHLFENNLINKHFKPYAVYGAETAEKIYSGNLNIIHRGVAGYNINHFVEEFDRLSLESDLIILDHIGYFDEVGNSGERKSLSLAAKKTNEMVNLYEVPVIMITHLNRPLRGSEALVPDLHSVHGSSDIAKESSKVAFIGRDRTDKKNNEWIFPTYIYPAKFRGFGAIDNYVGCIDYDIRKNQYSDSYVVGLLNRGKTGMTYLQYERKPWWAKRGV